MKTQLVILTIVIGLVSSGIAHAKEKAKAPVVVRDETDLLQFGKPTVKKSRVFRDGRSWTDAYVTVKNISAQRIAAGYVSATFLKGDEILAHAESTFLNLSPDSSTVIHFVSDYNVNGYDTLKLELGQCICGQGDELHQCTRHAR
jgi:hypothetical protein